MQALRFALLMCFAMALPAEARMYQWVNPATGSVQLSGTPPAWYRGADGAGPRVRVYEDGNLIDDTAIVLPPAHNSELREAAFSEFEERRQLEALQRLERAAKRQARRKEDAARVAEETQSAQVPLQSEIEPSDTPPEALGPEMIDRLKSIISEWDRRNAPAR